jgi:hypothetical protein
MLVATDSNSSYKSKPVDLVALEAYARTGPDEEFGRAISSVCAELKAVRKIVDVASQTMALIQAFGDFGDDEAEELGLVALSEALAEVGK